MPQKKGLTLIEVMIVIGIIAILGGATGFSLIRTRNAVSVDGTVTVLINDLKGQQLLSMSGYGQSGEYHPFYGIYFENDRYILFHSDTYSESDNSNFIINLDQSNEFSIINLPNNQIIFSSSSGAITNYNPTQNFVTIQDKNTNIQKTLYFNLFGVVYEIN